MSVIIHFLGGNDESIQEHYFQKEYRTDVIVEINSKYYEVYFFVEGTIIYEMRKDGFFSMPGLIILDEITNLKIFNAIKHLLDIGYFESFIGFEKIPFMNSFIHKWYLNDFPEFDPKLISSYVLAE